MTGAWRSLALTVLVGGIVGAETIHLKTRDLEPQRDPTAYLGSPLLRRNAGISHYMVQFQGHVTAEIFERLRELGIKVTGYLPDAALMIAAPDEFSLQGLPGVWVGRLDHRERLCPLVSAR